MHVIRKGRVREAPKWDVVSQARFIQCVWIICIVFRFLPTSSHHRAPGSNSLQHNPFTQLGVEVQDE